MHINREVGDEVFTDAVQQDRYGCSAQRYAGADRLDEAKSGEEQFAVHQDYYRITDHIMTLMTIAEIRHDIDMTDEFYRKEQDFYDTVQPEIRNLNVAYQKKLYESPFRLVKTLELFAQ